MSEGLERSIIPEESMREDSTTSRIPQTTGSAATIVALLSMATMVSGVSAMSTSRAHPSETRPATVETTSVREMAVAVVAAAARNLLVSDRHDSALTISAFLPVESADSLDVRIDLPGTAQPAGFLLDERLIDLPPPGC